MTMFIKLICPKTFGERLQNLGQILFKKGNMMHIWKEHPLYLNDLSLGEGLRGSKRKYNTICPPSRTKENIKEAILCTIFLHSSWFLEVLNGYYALILYSLLCSDLSKILKNILYILCDERQAELYQDTCTKGHILANKKINSLCKSKLESKTIPTETEGVPTK
ncbi:hypothetical protein CR513_36416, partial [Mucuna pruriens]